MIYPHMGRYPDIHPTVFITPDVTIAGDVTIGEDASVWFGTVIRGDVHEVRIGARTNIQDNCTLHETDGKFPLYIGADVTVGHAAVLHGCSIGDSCLIGMKAVILDGAEIGEGCLVAAGAVVLEHSRIPAGSLVAGVPAKIVRSLSEEERGIGRYLAKKYLRYIAEYREHGDLDRPLSVEQYMELKKGGGI